MHKAAAGGFVYLLFFWVSIWLRRRGPARLRRGFRRVLGRCPECQSDGVLGERGSPEPWRRIGGRLRLSGIADRHILDSRGGGGFQDLRSDRRRADGECQCARRRQARGRRRLAIRFGGRGNSLVDSRSSTVGTLIDERRVVDLPTNGRNIISLAGILPVSPWWRARNIHGRPQRAHGFRIGIAAERKLFLFDGADFNAVFRNTGLNYPPPDALQEVKVLTNSFSAEYGRNAGAVFNVVTKSGTNQLHGARGSFCAIRI